VNSILTATTRGDGARLVQLRAAFLDQLLADPRVGQLFDDRWGPQSGLYRAADAAAIAHNTAADAQARPPAAKRRDAATARLFAALHHATLDPSPIAFVRDTLQLRSHNHWIAAELCDAFHTRAITRALGIQFLTSGRVVVEDVAPPVRVVFDTRPGESSAEARTRLDQSYQDACMTLARATQAPRRRGPNHDPAYLHKWATWVYCVHVKRPRADRAALAREYHVNRRTIQLGIQCTMRLLGVDVLPDRPPAKIKRAKRPR
jgi:hypothetical protein